MDRTRALRVLLWTTIALSWLAMLLFAWSAFATLPSAERLQESRMARIPTLGFLLRLGARSAAEAAALLALLWPWRPRWYLRRLALAALLLPLWFIFTAPLSLTAVEWVHRRWLAGLELALLAALLLYPLIRAWERRRFGTAGA